MQNPILRGFHPDPSIVRVGVDYYVATSTFEWFPGVMIYHSQDLINWTLVARPLDRLSLLDLKGVPDSCGVWAPCLSHDGERFHLVYSRVRSFDGMWKDTPNFLITAADISGPWSEPVYLNSKGFDGSLFHDQDGTKWYLSMQVDHRQGRFFGGIIMQEYDPHLQRLVGPKLPIFEGTPLGLTEGPHLYQKDGYYYLLTAEGGTEYGHAVSLARSQNRIGPYENHPQSPLLSHREIPEHPLQKTGHADLVSTPTGDWFMVFLVGRPLETLGNCPLGRETAIAALNWPAGAWPAVTDSPLVGVEIPALGHIPSPGPIREVVNFQFDSLPSSYHSLRIPRTEDWVSHSAGKLSLKGRESLSSTFEQSTLARRLQSWHARYEALMDYNPSSFQHMAGLICYYNTGHYYYFCISWEASTAQKILQLVEVDNFQYRELLPSPIPLPPSGNIRLAAAFDRSDISFSYQLPQAEWQEIAAKGDLNILSDDHVREGSDRYRPAFTGAFVGISCQDLQSGDRRADFYELSYVEA